MKKNIYIISIFVFANIYSCIAKSISLQDNVVVSISQNDLIIVSDVSKIKKYAKLKDLSDRAAEQVRLADEAYLKGVQLLQQSENAQAILSFKTAFKNYKRAKINDDALNFPNLQLALAHQVSNDARNQKKVPRYLDLITKSVEKEKEWLYNLSILNYLNGKESIAAEQLEALLN